MSEDAVQATAKQFVEDYPKRFGCFVGMKTNSYQ